ncbi:CBS domain-containing protein [Streptomyces sp. H10-C2]|uniref:CBS domain-containing protein n=1 Tax=unclassified Streptomyces TaxID=2593676 RepID=UPI0024BB9C9D|nr:MULTISPECIES: CBS domain-containing protein [unclassified Streptomyces]MDJ0346968.1 CBS domain-containing protein [Streptomyces sp. PH10-H1]MDJ0374633.1 CBS domain-containing protein [Streptomyces sp. H10-C2]
MVAQAWVVRAGSEGEREQYAIDEALVVVGWEEVEHDLSTCQSIDELDAVLDKTYPQVAAGTRNNWKHQLWRFKAKMSVGDFVVMPRKFQPFVAVGEVTGPYEYRADAEPGFRHVRPVSWRRKDVMRAAIGGDLRDSMGAFLTVSGLSRRNAAQRVQELASSGIDPGYDGDIEPPADATALVLEVEQEGTRQLTARALIGLWGWQRRTNDVIDIVDAELAVRGLRATPHFTEVALDGLVTVSAIDAAEVQADTQAQQGADRAGGVTEVDLGRHWRIGSLLPSVRNVTTVAYDAPLSTALTWMVEHDYSQLPVVNDNNVLRGVITWESIARAQLAKREPTVAAAIDPHPHTAHEQEELLVRIGDIRQHGFLIVTDRYNLVVGILTASDLAEQLRLRVEPFILLGEAERRLRRLTRSIDPDHLPQASGIRKKKLDRNEELTLGQYPALLADETCWADLDWPYDQNGIVSRVAVVKDYRNELAHWDVDAPEQKTEPLAATKRLLKLLKLLDYDPQP